MGTDFKAAGAAHASAAGEAGIVFGRPGTHFMPQGVKSPGQFARIRCTSRIYGLFSSFAESASLAVPQIPP